MRRAHAIGKARGAAAVEFAVVLPVLLAIVCGTIDWGYYFFTREIVVNAAREGARVGTLQFGPAVPDPRREAEHAALEYLRTASLEPAKATIESVALDGGACPANASCIRITYVLGGSITGFTAPFIPNSILAYSQMRIRL